MTFEPLDPATASDQDLAAVHEVFAAGERAAGVPEVLIPPPRQGVLDLCHPPATVLRRMVVARDAGAIVGAAAWEWEDVASNRDHVFVGVDVAPGARGRGLGRELLATAVAQACDEFHPRLIDAEARRDDPAVHALLGGVGFEARLSSPRNVLWTAGLDRSMLEGWVARAAERAADYELVRWDGSVPKDLHDQFLELWHVMNTAPLESLEWDDEVMTPERSRAQEGAWSRRGVTPWAVVARHRPSGTFAGFTVVAVHEHWPQVAAQEDTGVLPEHRDRGLGRWLKAVNALRILDERAEVEAVTTWNAGSNAPMLGINHAMGFAPVEWWAEWQVEAKRARELLN